MSNMNAPYSQCDSKGRCIRHPTIQMSRKKKLGGWKTLLSLCPMCAMELMNSEDCAGGSPSAYCGDVAAPRPPSSSVERGMRPPVQGSPAPSTSYHHSNNGNSSSSSRHGSRRSRPHADDRSIAHSVRSAPSTYNRRDSQESYGSSSDRRSHSHSHNHPSVAKPQSHARHGTSSSDSSCDSTVDMSYSSHSSAGHASSPRGSYRRSNSNNSRASAHSSSGSSRVSQHHSARSAAGTSQQQRRRQVPQVGHHDVNVNTLPPNQEQFVCGMEYGEPGMFYTGQIDVASQLPHGLGTLRSECDKTMFEGEWRFGRLVQENNNGGGGHQQQDVEEGEDFCQPCEASESLSQNFQRQCHVVPGLENCEEGSESSFSNNSIAETIHDEDDTQSQSSWSRLSSSSSNFSQNSSYSARESKASLPPRNSRINSQGTSRATSSKPKDYEQYVERCDTEEDYYSYDDNSRGADSRRSSSHGSQLSGVGGADNEYDSRPRRVRFREDP